MNAHEKALEAATDALVAEWPKMRPGNRSYWREHTQVILDSYLSALPPSIVVDGRVVELFAPDGEWAEWVPNPLSYGGQGVAFGTKLRLLLDAAREVAGD